MAGSNREATSLYELAAKETGIIVTAEEPQIGALAWPVSRIITTSPDLYGSVETPRFVDEHIESLPLLGSLRRHL